MTRVSEIKLTAVAGSEYQGHDTGHRRLGSHRSHVVCTPAIRGAGGTISRALGYSCLVPSFGMVLSCPLRLMSGEDCGQGNSECAACKSAGRRSVIDVR